MKRTKTFGMARDKAMEQKRCVVENRLCYLTRPELGSKTSKTTALRGVVGIGPQTTPIAHASVTQHDVEDCFLVRIVLPSVNTYTCLRGGVT